MALCIKIVKVYCCSGRSCRSGGAPGGSPFLNIAPPQLPGEVGPIALDANVVLVVGVERVCPEKKLGIETNISNWDSQLFKPKWSYIKYIK